MKQFLIAPLTALISLSLLVFSSNIHSHGGVVLDEDICLIKVGFFQAHFTVFQPQTKGHEQFCEDLPDIGESIFVLEYLHDGLEKMHVDFRIIENLTGNGPFTNKADVELIDDVDAITVFYQPALQNPDVFAVLHDFQEEGEFIGIITAKHPENAKIYTAVFPFEAGFTSNDVNDLTVLFVVLFIFFSWLAYLAFKRTKSKPVFTSLLAAFLVTLVFSPLNATAQTADSETISGKSKTYLLTGDPSIKPLAINQIHSWTVKLTTHDNNLVEKAHLNIAGGMPLHDHGLATQPRMVAETRPGHYQIDGLKFHMRGYWEITITVEKDGINETLTVGLNL